MWDGGCLPDQTASVAVSASWSGSVGALAEKMTLKQPWIISMIRKPLLWFSLHQPSRTARGEGPGAPAGANLEGQIVTALKHLGDVVLDTTLP
ncbi:MAG: hypothetical protein R2941_13695 [Desulfobacterales bacterium]